MTKKLTVLRNESAYEVHIEMEAPPRKFVGGQSLDLDRLKTELVQHGCSREMIDKAVQDLNSGQRAVISL